MKENKYLFVFEMELNDSDLLDVSVINQKFFGNVSYKIFKEVVLFLVFGWFQLIFLGLNGIQMEKIFLLYIFFCD